MSRRAILNFTSVKKKDNRQAIYNTSDTNDTNFTSTPQTMGPAGFYVYGYCPTAMARQQQTDGAVENNESLRTSNVCYMRGLKEIYDIKMVGGGSWRWRRICFTAKRPDFALAAGTDRLTSFDVTRGYQRPFANANPTMRGSLFVQLFEGTQGQDWSNAMTAKLDREQFNIKYDRLITLNPQNDISEAKLIKFYHPMNANLYYDEDETGNSYRRSPYSVPGKGMGDYFVIDIIESVGSSVTTGMQILPQSTLYWHEK